MSQRTYPAGVTYVPLIVAVNDDGPVSGLTVKAKILRPLDSAQWDFSDDMFKIPGAVVTPQLTLTESAEQAGLYVGPWNTASILVVTDAVVIYESTSLAFFIADDPVSILTNAAGGSAVRPFIEPVIDVTQRLMTILFGLRSSLSDIIATTSAAVTLKDELGNTIAVANTTSTNGIHRAHFPNLSLVPNRVLLVYITFTFGMSTLDTVDAIRVIGASLN